MTRTRTDPYSLRHQTQRTATDADQAEFSAMRNGSATVDTGIFDERVAAAMDDFEAEEPSSRERWHDEDLKYDSAVGSVQEEIERRIRIMGSAYPFALDQNSLTYNASSNRLYEFLLSICNSPNITKGPYVQLPRTFERIAARLVAAFFGDHAKYVHIGYPRDTAVGKSFRKAMKYVADQTGEWTWGPEDGLPQDPPHGDGGCDFLVWPDSLDGRKIGQLFVLGQCACGNDWPSKYHDLDISKLAKWFNPPFIVPAIRAFATPFHVTDAYLKEASREAGYFLDRARLVMIGQKRPQASIAKDFGEVIDGLIRLVLGR